MADLNVNGRQGAAARAREIIVTDDGPWLVSGPVEIVMPDGRRVKSERPVTALCVCKRSRRQPFCDTSHRCRVHRDEMARLEMAADEMTGEENRAQPEPTSPG